MGSITKDMILRLECMIENASKIVLLTHTHPDGDAIGSTTALYHYLKVLRQKELKILIPDPYPERFSFFVEADSIIDASQEATKARECLAKADLVFCLDVSGSDRTAELSAPFRACKQPKVLIDHHLNPAEEEFDLVFSQTTVSSTCELLYQILIALPRVKGAESLPKDCLKALMVGMTTDTNNFANSVFPSTLVMASDLLASGVDRDEILVNLFNKYGENRFRAMGEVLQSLMKITPEGLAYFIINREFIEKHDIKEGDTEGFVNIPLGIDKVKVSLFLKEDLGYYRVSARSKMGWSANLLCKTYFNGGGHECAAGGRLYFPKDIAQKEDAHIYIEEVTARFMREQNDKNR